MSKVNVDPIRKRAEQRCTDLTAALVDREALLALHDQAERLYQSLGMVWQKTEEENTALRARIATLEAQVEQARELLSAWTDMDPLRYDSEYSACPWCDFDYPNMRHEQDCAFVQARAFVGIGQALQGGAE